MEAQPAPAFEPIETIVLPSGGQTAALSAGQATDNGRTTHGQTYTFKKAAAILGCNESTLRRRYWQEKVEPAFKHCPTPLRTIARFNRDHQPVFEFSEYGLEVLKAFIQAKAEGQEESFLWEASQKYPAPTEFPSSTQASKPEGAMVLIKSMMDGATEESVEDAEFVDPDEILAQMALKNQEGSTALSLREQQTQALNTQTAQRLQRLQELFTERRKQQQQKQTQKQAQWDAEIEGEVLEEFLYKQSRREEMWEALEALTHMGKSPAAPSSSAG